MKLLLLFFVILNFALIISFLAGVLFIFKKNTKPVISAYYSLFLSALLIFYLAGAIIISLTLFYRGYYSGLPFIAFLFMPFVIGSGANYEKIRFFTFVQIFVFALSLVYSLYLYFKFL